MGLPFDDEEIGPVTWDGFMDKKVTELKKCNPHIGSSLDDFLNEERVLEETRAIVLKEASRNKLNKLTKDPLTGIPVLDAGVDAPKLTSREVEKILTSFL